MRDLNGKKLIIQYYVMDGVRRMVKNIGYCKIAGVRLGARRVDLGKIIYFKLLNIYI
jgi:hypothetical protein